MIVVAILFLASGICHLLAALGVKATVSWTELAWSLFVFAFAVAGFGAGYGVIR